MQKILLSPWRSWEITTDIPDCSPFFGFFSLTRAALISYTQAWVWVCAHAHVVWNETLSYEHFYLREEMMGVDTWLVLVMLLSTLVGGNKMLLR